MKGRGTKSAERENMSKRINGTKGTGLNACYRPRHIKKAQYRKQAGKKKEKAS